MSIFVAAFFAALLGVTSWLIVGVFGIVVQLRVNQSYTFSKAQFLEGWG